MQRTGASTPFSRRLAALLVALVASLATACAISQPETPGQVTGSGTLEGKNVIVASELGGRVENMFVDEGDTVSAGQVVVTLDESEARVLVAQAEAGVSAAEANLADLHADPRPEAVRAAEAALEMAEIELEAAADKVIRAREAITDPVTLDLQIAQARLERDLARRGIEQAEAELAAEELNYHIYVDLKENVSQETRRSWDLRVEVARKKIEQAVAEADAAQAELDGLLSLRANPLQAIAELHAAESAYTVTTFVVEEASAELTNVRAGTRAEEIAKAEAKLEQTRAGLDLALAHQSMLTLTAPISGVVATRHHYPGERAAAGRPILTITDLDVLQLRLYVPETHIYLIRTGQSVTVTVDALPEEMFFGTVARIATEAEYTPRTAETTGDRARRVFAVEIELPNPAHRLQPGLPAQAVIDTSSVSKGSPQP
ncbi:MAG: HlyD family secretion protein [Anaerolineae bacterium]